MSASVLVCGALFDGFSEELASRTEILVRDGQIAEIGASVQRPDGAEVVDLSERTVSPGFIDTHVHLTMDASDLAQQTLQPSAAKALKGLSLAREYLHYGFTTLRDLGSMDPDFPTVDLRNAIDAGIVEGPRLFVAGHIISASAGHGDLRGFYASRWDLPVSAIADGVEEIRRLVRREHTYGSDWIKTANAGGYFSVGDDPARPTWFDEEMEAVCSTAQLLGMPVAGHRCRRRSESWRCGLRVRTRAGGIAGSAVSCASWAALSRRRAFAGCWRAPVSSRRRDVAGRVGGSSSGRRLAA